MRIGFNFTRSEVLPIANKLLNDGHIDYYEILIDNFLHLDPHELLATIKCPVSFHIMRSRFLENGRESLSQMAEQIRYHAHILKPIYISDHLASFSCNGQNLSFLSEIDYRNRKVLIEKASWWQEQIGEKLFLENFPSILDGGFEAPEFFSDLRREVGTGLLFDISNAVCSEINCGASTESWISEANETRHFHVGSYEPSVSDPNVMIDTHGTEISVETLSFLSDLRSRLCHSETTITYERDRNVEYDSIVQDITRIRQQITLQKNAVK